MSKFYKELKELRESRKISLDEISERTKINVQYLQDIEKGSFEDIETPYLRLFLRAYAEEIGSDSQRALEQLDSYKVLLFHSQKLLSNIFLVRLEQKA